MPARMGEGRDELVETRLDRRPERLTCRPIRREQEHRQHEYEEPYADRGPVMRSPSLIAGSRPKSGERPKSVLPLSGSAATNPSVMMRLSSPPT